MTISSSYSAPAQCAGAKGPGRVLLSRSKDLMPHFETVEGRQVFYVDGWPFTILAVEIPWEGLVCGKYKETQHVYDNLYPAAQAMKLNTLIVPVKWSMVEPEKDVFEFSYVDHAKSMAEKHNLKLVLGWFGHYASNDGNIYINLTGEVFAPSYIIHDEKTYPRAVDADGVSHHNAVSYEYDAVIDREAAAYHAFMQHIKKVDSETRTILMIQLENEIAVFGGNRRDDRKLWRDHSPPANELFAARGFTDDLKYSAWRLSSNWLRRVADAGAGAYALPTYVNFVRGQLEEELLGGAPGEDVAIYLENCPAISFVGVDLYLPPDSSVNDFRTALSHYRIDRNLPAITETNSDRSAVAPRLAFIAIGEFGAPIFAPWSLTISYLGSFQSYVLEDGTLANGAYALRDCYASLCKALDQVSYFANTRRLKAFMARLPGQKFSDAIELGEVKVRVTGEQDGQTIVLQSSVKELVILGYRCNVSLWNDVFTWPALKQVHVEKGFWVHDKWASEGEPFYVFDQDDKRMDLNLDAPQAIRISW